MLNKYYFLNDQDTIRFIDFLKYEYFNSRSNVSGLLNQYRWPDNTKGLDFEETFQKVSAMRIQIKNAVNKRNEYGVYEISSDILNWGGVGVATKNIRVLESFKKERRLLDVIREARTLIRSSLLDMEQFRLPVNSGFSKIYTLLDDHFIIYDSRVAAKMCNLVKKCFGSNPETLSLGKCDFQAKVNRDPGPEFPMLTGRPARYFESNLKAAWILEKLALEHNPLNYPVDKTIFAYQTALFVDGYELQLQVGETGYSGSGQAHPLH